MNKLHVAGIALFLVALAIFLLILPESRDISGVEPVQIEEEKWDYSAAQTVNSLPAPEEVSRPPVRSEEPNTGFEITLADLAGHEVGDEIDLLIPQEGRSYRGKITQTNVTEAGNQVMTGFFDPETRSQRFIFTVGRFQTFGTIQTSQGRYQLETRNGSGRIISLATINEKLDFSKPDYVIPQRTDKHEGG